MQSVSTCVYMYIYAYQCVNLDSAPCMEDYTQVCIRERERARERGRERKNLQSVYTCAYMYIGICNDSISTLRVASRITQRCVYVCVREGERARERAAERERIT